MDINKTKNGSSLNVVLSGRLDTMTSPQLEKELKADIAGVEELVLDLGELAYISSAGLRVLLSAQKIMMKQGEMIVCNVPDSIMEIFEVTGFSDILTIQ